eukprot:6667321-Prymnesium_polylepis.1
MRTVTSKAGRTGALERASDINAISHVEAVVRPCHALVDLRARDIRRVVARWAAACTTPEVRR